MEKLRENLAALVGQKQVGPTLEIINEFLDRNLQETIGCGDCGNRGSNAFAGWEQNLCERACGKPENMRG